MAAPGGRGGPGRGDPRPRRPVAGRPAGRPGRPLRRSRPALAGRRGRTTRRLGAGAAGRRPSAPAGSPGWRSLRRRLAELDRRGSGDRAGPASTSRRTPGPARWSPPPGWCRPRGKRSGPRRAQRATAADRLRALAAAGTEADRLDLGMLADDAIAIRSAAGADRERAGALIPLVADAQEQERDQAALDRGPATAPSGRSGRRSTSSSGWPRSRRGSPSWTGGSAQARSARDLLPAARSELGGCRTVREAAADACRRFAGRHRRAAAEASAGHGSAPGRGGRAAVAGAAPDRRDGRRAGPHARRRIALPGVRCHRAPQPRPARP